MLYMYPGLSTNTNVVELTLSSSKTIFIIPDLNLTKKGEQILEASNLQNIIKEPALSIMIRINHSIEDILALLFDLKFATFKPNRKPYDTAVSIELSSNHPLDLI